MLRGVKVKLYPNQQQKEYIKNLLGCTRYVYNKCLEYKKLNYDTDKTNVGLKQLGTHFHHTLLIDYPFLTDHNTKVLKQSIIDLLDSYSIFFSNGTGFPNFKSKYGSTQSVLFPSKAISSRNDYTTNRLTLTTQLKSLKFKCSGEYHNILSIADIKSATLVHSKADGYWLSFLVDTDYKKFVPESSNEIGIDLGIKDFVITSDGDKFKNIKSQRSKRKKLKRLHRRLSKKQKGSKNKNKALIVLAKQYEKIKNILTEYLHEVSNALINNNHVIAMETLNVSGMMKNHKLAAAIAELSLSEFKRILKYKAERHGRIIVEISRWFASSKICSGCGHINHELKLEEREWCCHICGSIHDRDVNAAINILVEGLRQLKYEIDNPPVIKQKTIPSRRRKLKPVCSTRVDDCPLMDDPNSNVALKSNDSVKQEIETYNSYSQNV